MILESEIPPPKKADEPKYPFSVMEIGQSFAVPKEKAQVFRNAIGAYKYKHYRKGWNYVTRTENGMTRFWRTA